MENTGNPSGSAIASAKVGEDASDQPHISFRLALPWNETPMLFLRTATGGFVDAATIVRLSDGKEGDEIRWVAICDDGREVALAAYYSAPGRLKEVQHLLSRQHASSIPHAAAVEADCLTAGCDCVR